MQINTHGIQLKINEFAVFSVFGILGHGADSAVGNDIT